MRYPEEKNPMRFAEGIPEITPKEGRERTPGAITTETHEAIPGVTSTETPKELLKNPRKKSWWIFRWKSWRDLEEIRLQNLSMKDIVCRIIGK